MTERETLTKSENEPRPNWIPRMRYGRTVGISLAFCACVLGALASYFRISGFRDLLAYGGMAAECHPIWAELAFRRIKPGDNFIPKRNAMPPDSQEHLGEYSFYDYGTGFTSLRVFTKDDRIVAAGAGSCTWDYAFFDTLPQADWTKLNDRYTLVLEERYRDKYGDTDNTTEDQTARSVDGG